MPNTGYIPEVPKETDYIAGGESGITYKAVTNDWKPVLPNDEKQKFRNFDTMACVTFSCANSIETQVNYLIRHVLPQETIDKLDELGFLDADYKFNISDRALAKMSGTTREGNMLTKVIHTARKQGLLPERDWKTSEKFDWDDYYAEIPQKLKDKALKILDIFEFKYEWVLYPTTKNGIDNITYHLKQAPIQIAAPVCNGWSTGDVKTCPKVDPEHATMAYEVSDKVSIIDHYDPFKKKLALDYPILWGQKIVVEVKQPKKEPVKPKHAFAFILLKGMTAKNSPEYIVEDIKALQDILRYEGLLTVNSTGNYLNLTATAVLKWQIKHNVAPLAELKMLKGERVGQKTLAKLNELYNM